MASHHGRHRRANRVRIRRAAASGWRERSRVRFREGALEVFDFDLYSQALSKIERGFDLDLADARAMIYAGHVDPPVLRELFDQVEDQLYRFPAVDQAGLRAKLDHA